MKYIDMHCDTVTVCADAGSRLFDCNLQTSFKKLVSGGCAAQCFAIFTQGDTARDDFFRYLSFYKNTIKENSRTVIPVNTASDLEECVGGGKTGCILTVENLGFAGGGDLFFLADCGVKMASLVWNYENAYAAPNLIFDGEMPLFEKRSEKGLTDRGIKAVEELDFMKIIVDISHLSDGGAAQILKGRKIPCVASHSNAERVCGVCRNLTDEQIRGIADCGGVIGVNFCADFLGGEALEYVYRHLNHMISVGGEDVVALGSDFDGIPENEHIKDCTAMPDLFESLSSRGLKPRVLEKLAHGNFVRVFRQVCG